MLEVLRLQGARQGAQVCVHAVDVVEHQHAIRGRQLRQVGEECTAERPLRQGPACQCECSQSAQHWFTQLLIWRALTQLIYGAGVAEYARTHESSTGVMTVLTHYTLQE